MKIDHAEALQRGREYWISNGKAYAGHKVAEQIAALIEQAVRETTEECARNSEWAALNRERCLLIDRNIAGSLDEPGLERLDALNRYADARLAVLLPGSKYPNEES